MGLDITAYKNLRQFNAQYDNENDEVLNLDTNEVVGWRDHFLSCVHSEYTDRAKDIADGAYFFFEKVTKFRAGSYGGYNDWREQLAKLAGYPSVNGEKEPRHAHSNGAWKATEGAFWELISFSDCEGLIGTEVSKKLLNDFINFDSKAQEIGGNFYELYGYWKEAFEYASENGAVDFH